MLNKSLIADLIYTALSTGGDFAEVFVEDKHSNHLQMISGKLEDISSGRAYGIGIRIMDKTNVVYVYSNDDNRENLLKVAQKGAEALKELRKVSKVNLIKKEINNLHPFKINPQKIAQTQKVDLMREAHETAHNYDQLVSQVVVNYLDHKQNVLIANSNGLWVEDERVRTRTMIQVVATKGQEKQTGFYGPGASQGFEFYQTIDIKEYAQEAARTAVTMVKAKSCPSGKMPVIIANEFGGVIFHEACGHGLEATSVAKKTSVFHDKLGEKIASPLVTAIDDGTITNAWGSQNIDDEGMLMQKNILIEKGVLKGFLIDSLNARKMGMEATASARRQSYQFAPTSRMSNTYIVAGESKPKDIIANTEKGLYAKYLGGGSVNPATGEFNFNVREGYLIENGKIKEPVRGATLIGKGSEILKKIDMVGDDLAYGQGMCGSISGSIPTNVGQPMLRVTELTVGGRKDDN